MKTTPHRWHRRALGSFLRDSFGAVPASVPEARGGIDTALRALSLRPPTEWVRPDHLIMAVVEDVCVDPRTGNLRTDLGRGISTAPEALAAIVEGWTPAEVYPREIRVECYSPFTAPGGEIPVEWDVSGSPTAGTPSAVLTKDTWFYSRGPWLPAHTYGGPHGDDWHGLALSRLADGRWVGDLYLHATPPRDMLIVVHPDLVRERLRSEYGFSPFSVSRIMDGDPVEDFADIPARLPGQLALTS